MVILNLLLGVSLQKNYLNCDWSSHGTSQESDLSDCQQGEETSCSQCTVDFQDGRFFSKSPENLYGGSLEDFMEENYDMMLCRKLICYFKIN